MSNSIIALGTFDGVHLGHRMLFQKAQELANEKGYDFLIYTFKNHPLTLFNKTPKLLMSAQERVDALSALGANNVIAQNFDADLASMPPQEFLRMLVEQYGMKVAVAGFNYTFGCFGSGDTKLLFELGKEMGFESVTIPPVHYKGWHVSSTRIRECIENGEMDDAAAMLTAPYTLSGKVIENRHIGRKIGFPTANINSTPLKVMPLQGVYATHAILNGKTYNAVTNIGQNPTVDGKKTTIETHLMDYDGNIYGEMLNVEFLKRLRGDVKFSSVDELARQISLDISSAKGYFAGLQNLPRVL